MASTNGALRMSGMNSGFDTESIVNAMTASTKLKITTNERKVLKLKATQDAYRDIIGKMTTFQNKYFDMLNTKTYLKSSNIFNKYSAKITQGTEEKTPAGVKVSCTNYSTPGDYDVRVNNTATQATLTGKALGSNLDIGLSGAAANTDYSLNVTVGGVAKTVSFNSGADSAAAIANLNDALKSEFGEANDGSGLVYADATGTLVSQSKASMSSSGVFAMTASKTIDTTTAATGKNTFSITVGDETKTVNVDTYSETEFDALFEADGSYVADPDNALKAKYEEVLQELYTASADEEYDAFKESADDADKALLLDEAYDAANEAHKTEQYNTLTETEARAQYEADGETGEFEDYLANFRTENPESGYTLEELDRDNFESVTYNEEKAFKELRATSKEDFVDALDNPLDHRAVKIYNEQSLKNSLENVTFTDGTKLTVANSGGILTVAAEKEDAAVNLGITVTNGSASTFGFSNNATKSTAINANSTISALGLTADANGKYNFSINGTDFSFTADTTIRNMMREIQTSDAGVTMSFTSLTNQFTITSTEYGTDSEITYADGGEGLLSALGIAAGETTFTAGENLNLTVNGETVEVESNSYTFDGITMSFSAGSEGAEFSTSVKRDYTDAIAAVKSFVEDYNTLISDVYGYIKQKPDKDYYFLTDDDVDEMELSDKQEEKWETKAKQGLLYNDSAVSGIMSKLRTALYAGIDGSDGKKFGLYSMGITTSSDWTKNGILEFSSADGKSADEVLQDAFENHADDISALFTNSENGIMNAFDEILDSAVKATGAREDKGILVQKAGLATGTSSTDNAIYDQLKDISTLLDSLNNRYEEQQDRYWKIYSNMETQLSELNNQTSSITSLFSS